MKQWNATAMRQQYRSGQLSFLRGKIFYYKNFWKVKTVVTLLYKKPCCDRKRIWDTPTSDPSIPYEKNKKKIKNSSFPRCQRTSIMMKSVDRNYQSTLKRPLRLTTLAKDLDRQSVTSAKMHKRIIPVIFWSRFLLASVCHSEAISCPV